MHYALDDKMRPREITLSKITYAVNMTVKTSATQDLINQRAKLDGFVVVAVVLTSFSYLQRNHLAWNSRR